MVRKILFVLLAALLLVGCGNNNALSEDFKEDVEQVLSIIKEAYENQEDYSEKENELLFSFSDKYKKGQYIPSGENDYYEMNDIEKAIFSNVNTMRLFAVDFDEDSLTLASETGEEISLYENTKKELDELMKINSIEDLPEELKGKYPTYEVYYEMYPEQFIKDAKELLALYDPIVNGTQSDVTNKEWYPLVSFLEQYQGEDTTFPIDYEQDGKHYLIDSNMRRIINMFNDLKKDIDEGSLLFTTTDEFNSVIDLVERTDI